MLFNMAQSPEELESFCSNLDSLLSKINDQYPVCSTDIENFDAKCSKWCTADKDRRASLELDKIAATGYSQMITKPTYITNEPSSRM